MCALFVCVSGEVFDYLVSHGRMKEKEARAKFRQVSPSQNVLGLSVWALLSVWPVEASIMLHPLSLPIM